MKMCRAVLHRSTEIQSVEKIGENEILKIDFGWTLFEEEIKKSNFKKSKLSDSISKLFPFLGPYDLLFKRSPTDSQFSKFHLPPFIT